MSRLEPIPPERLDAEQRCLYDSIVGGRRVSQQGRVGGLTAADGSLSGPFNAYLRSPAIGTCLSALGEALRFDADLPKDLLELAVIVVARHTSAQFEWYAHANFARVAGVPDDVIAAIAERREPPLDPGSDRAVVYRAARQLTENHRIDDPTYAELLSRFGERQAFELVALVGFYGAISAVLNAFEVPLPEGVTPLPA